MTYIVLKAPLNSNQPTNQPYSNIMQSCCWFSCAVIGTGLVYRPQLPVFQDFELQAKALYTALFKHFTIYR